MRIIISFETLSAANMSASLMNAVVIHGPHDIRVEKKPRPVTQDGRDAIVRVTVAGICGSELHPYRGHQKTTFGHIMVSGISSQLRVGDLLEL